jgi:hypothetical protein
MNGESRNSNRQLVKKRPLGRSRHRWVDNMKMDLAEIEWWEGVMGWFGLPQDRNKWRALVNVVMILLGSIKCLEVLEWLHNRWPHE